MLSGMFGRKRKYASVSKKQLKADIPEGLMKKCPSCHKIFYKKEMEEHLYVCPHCDYHLQLSAWERINSLVDAGTFIEWDDHLRSNNPLDFPEYEEKLKGDQEKTDLHEAIVTGKGTINGYKSAICVMDARFRMGSMGSVVGEKIARAFERASKDHRPLILFSASGGARMQEGVLSLMQMTKTSMAIQRFSNAKGLFISVMTHPTTGGVSASFASLGDYNFAEPKALIGFAGRRIIEQTIREKLPEDFQTAEFLLEHGQLDQVVHRHDMKKLLTSLLKIHAKGGHAQ